MKLLRKILKGISLTSVLFVFQACYGTEPALSMEEVMFKVVSAEDVKRGKPYPDIYEYACRKLNLRPEECIAYEDSPNGIISAHDAGINAIMIPDM